MAWHFDPDEPRDPHGRWTAAGLLKLGIRIGNGPNAGVTLHGEHAGSVRKDARTGLYHAHDANGKRTSRTKAYKSKAEAAAHVGAKHMERGPKSEPWVEPPQPTGKSGERKAGGLTAIGITNTELGDKVEQALQKLMHFEGAHPGIRQGRFDVYWDGHAYEVKAVSSSATEYKAKPKAHEVQEKLDFAKQNKLKPHIMIVVYNPSKKRLFVYSKEGVGAYRLTGPSAGWKFHGTIPLNLGSTWDPAAGI